MTAIASIEWSHAPRDDWPVGHAWREWLEAQGQDLGALCKPT